MGQPISLSIWQREEKLDPSRQPDPSERAWPKTGSSTFKAGARIARVTSCFGCGANKSTEETLTIVYRQGKLMVGGYSRDWD